MKCSYTLAGLAVGASLFASAAWADVNIVAVGPMSGQFANYWPQIENGATAAVAEVNEAGGINGEQVVLSLGDDACDPKQAVSVANRNVEQDYAVVIGHFCSGSSITASDVYNEEGVIMISGASVNSTLTERGMPYVFRTVGRDDQQGKVAAAAIASGVYGSKVALVHDKSAFGQGLVDKTKAFLGEAGVTPGLEDSITAGENDYSALVTRIVNEGIDVLYFGGYHREAGLIVKQARQAGFKGIFMSGDGIKAQEFVTVAGDAAEGVLFTFFPDPTQDPKAKPALDRLKAMGASGDGFTLYIYAAIQAYADAANRAGSTDPEAVAAAMRDAPVQTVVGSLQFNKKGDVDRNLYSLFKWEGGKIAHLE